MQFLHCLRFQVVISRTTIHNIYFNVVLTESTRLLSSHVRISHLFIAPVAQLDRVQASEAWGRWFKSTRPDHLLFPHLQHNSMSTVLAVFCSLDLAAELLDIGQRSIQ